MNDPDVNVRAGRLDQRIIIEQPAQTADSFGQVSYGAQAAQGSWSTVVECWAHIAPLRGQEFLRSGRDLSELWVAITVRYRAAMTVTPKMRARHKVTGQIYDIQYVAQTEFARRTIELGCVVTK